MPEPTEPVEAHDEGQGYLVPEDALERLERLVSVLSEPLVAYTAELAGERDEARERARLAEVRANRLLKALQTMVDAWPQTSWGASEEARDTAVALMDELAQEGATIGSPEQPTDQETHTHAPRPHRRHPDSPDPVG